jgi:glutamate synthase (NADPH/NADH) small chain
MDSSPSGLVTHVIDRRIARMRTEVWSFTPTPGLDAIRVAWGKGPDGRPGMQEIAGSEFHIKADLVLLAMGFVHPVHDGAVEALGVALDGRGNVRATDIDYLTSRPNVFVAGDARRGQSLVVWAIREGRRRARAVDEALTGRRELPR